MVSVMKTYPLSAARKLAVYSQGLAATKQINATAKPEDIQKTVERLGCVQLDTLNLVQRSHYLVVWSRLGSYAPADFDALLYAPEKRVLFEGWQRVASIIPLKDYRYQLPRMERMRKNHSEGFLRWFDQEGHELMPMVLERIRKEGGLRAADFKYHGPRRGSWWDWKPAKTALEYLFAFGDLMISNRIHFQRVYDLTERVLPEWVDTAQPTMEQRDRYWMERAALALGICQPNQLIGYNYFQRRPVQAVLEKLVEEKVLITVEVMLEGDGKDRYLVHHDYLEVLQKIADGAIQAERTTFLSPFDNLFWAVGRDEQLWGFRQRLEAYTPASKRLWGYFCMPILHHERLVGRFDPKMERKEGLLRLKALYLEDGVDQEDELLSGVANAMRDFMNFHKAQELIIEKSNPMDFGVRLQKLM